MIVPRCWLAALGLALLVAARPIESRRRGARGPAKRDEIFWVLAPEAAGSRLAIPTTGGDPKPVPQFMVTTWMPPNQGRGRDNRYIGNGIRLDQNHLLLPDAPVKTIEKDIVPERDHLLRRDKYQPANFFIDMNHDKVSVVNGPNNDKQRMFMLDPIMTNMENSGMGVYYMTKEENFTGKIPPLPYRPRLETDVNNLGENCMLQGYSRNPNPARPPARDINYEHIINNPPDFIKQHQGQSRRAAWLQPTRQPDPEDRIWTEFPVYTSKDLCNNGTCRLVAPQNNGICKGNGDRGLPVFCGPVGNRKITYMTKGNAQRAGLTTCTNDNIYAVHLGKLDTQIKHALTPGPPSPETLLNPGTTYVPSAWGGEAWNPVVRWFQNLG